MCWTERGYSAVPELTADNVTRNGEAGERSSMNRFCGASLRSPPAPVTSAGCGSAAIFQLALGACPSLEHDSGPAIAHDATGGWAFHPLPNPGLMSCWGPMS